MRTIKKNTVWLLPMCFLIMTVAVYFPTTMFLGNLDEFRIDYIDIVPMLILNSVLIGIICTVLYLCMRSVSSFFSAVLFGGALGCYLQSNFLNPKIGTLNGTRIHWSRFRAQGIVSIIVWLLCLILPIAGIMIKKDLTEKIIRCVSAFLTAVLILSLVILLATTRRIFTDEYVVTQNNMFDLSGGRNTVVFVVDTLDAQWLEETVLPTQEYHDMLDGFVYFDNAVSGGAPTILGMPALFTGETYYPADQEINDYYRAAYEKSTLFKDIRAAGAITRLYTPANNLQFSDWENISNVARGQYKILSHRRFEKSLVKMTLFNVLPQFLKKYIVTYSGEITNNIRGTSEDEEIYLLDDPAFYQKLCSDEMTAEESSDLFVLYHLFGAHGYYTMNELGERVEETRTDEGRQAQILGSFHIIKTFIDKMKDLGIYDDCTFIIMADHGGLDIYQNPAVLIRMPAHTGELETDHSPVMFRNVRASIAASMIPEYNYDQYGDTLFECEDSQDVRLHTFDSVLLQNIMPDHETDGEYMQAAIRGEARDAGSIELVSGSAQGGSSD